MFASRRPNQRVFASRENGTSVQVVYDSLRCLLVFQRAAHKSSRRTDLSECKNKSSDAKQCVIDKDSPLVSPETIMTRHYPIAMAIVTSMAISFVSVPEVKAQTGTPGTMHFQDTQRKAQEKARKSARTQKEKAAGHPASDSVPASAP
ncbi:hypothetical protein [Paraburkholderia sp. BL10I2N1]|uniref:hypothetical protein n=1 Tax=Paraburkholderia sp. BL10I2N1 TaxID=1938796 RepID=UPI00106040F4|nr:hypothetical protein [Paraburkholderia sp. BL10I2N1]TDN57794.1 hypothetical protein B0G77_8634 [Paraburkholderia sp. BL10I2N1]